MLHTVLLRNNLTENAFGTSPKRVLKCVPFAFHLRSICVPFAFHLRSKCVPFAFHFYWNAPAFRVPVTLVSKPDSVGNHRYFPSIINQRYFHILCLHVCKEVWGNFRNMQEKESFPYTQAELTGPKYKKPLTKRALKPREVR
jgi:hypothetical protein